MTEKRYPHPAVKHYPRIERLWRDVGDDSPWYDKALWHAVGSLLHEDPPERALHAIERTLADRPEAVA